mgnify:CR=1 FL=1
MPTMQSPEPNLNTDQSTSSQNDEGARAYKFIEPQWEGMPPELKNQNRWLTWKAVKRPTKPRPDKVPYSPNSRNKKGSSTDPQTWGSFEQAKAAYLMGGRTGIGFVLNGDGIVGVDIDNCVTDEEPSAQAMTLLESIAAAYIEISPSGTGLRAIGYGDQLDTGVNGYFDGLKGEFYSNARYLTLTGKSLKAGPLAHMPEFKATAERFRSGKKTKTDENTGQQENAGSKKRMAALMDAIISGTSYHDSLRDLAASFIANGTKPGAVVNYLSGLMDISRGARDERWQARRAQIPSLVSSAANKFSPNDFDEIDPQTGQVIKEHPLTKFIAVGATPMPPRWVIPGFIGQGVVVISGAHGVGKTTAMLPLAMIAAKLHGNALMPYEWRHVIYISEDVEQVHRIVAGIVGFSDLNIDPNHLNERLHIVQAMRLNPSYVASVGKHYRKQFTRIVDGVEVLPLVVLDTKSAVLALENENDNGEASRMMAALKQGFDGLPVWLIGHVAKANLSRSDIQGLSTRGASAIEADANQTIFLIQEVEARYLVLGKTRFEPLYRELEISSQTAQFIVPNEFGIPEKITMLWGIAQPAQQSRRQAAETALAQRRELESKALRKEVLDSVETAWNWGNPLNRAGIKEKVNRQAAKVVSTIKDLITERWLYEVEVASKDRVHQNKKAYLISLSSSERDAVLAGGLPSPEKLVPPASWSKSSVTHAPNDVGMDHRTDGVKCGR